MASNRLRKLATLIAATPDAELRSKLSLAQRTIVPILSAASSIYTLLLLARHRLYRLGLFRSHRLPVPVISVGNITWGGTGKTPTVEFLARLFADERHVTPLVLTRGYAGGDEAAMLRRHLSHSTAKIGVGADRVKTAMHFIKTHGYTDRDHGNVSKSIEHARRCEKIGIVILDDGMQHWRLSRDFDIVMVNGMTVWGNSRLIPRGPLREPLDALERADIVVIHNADTVSCGSLSALVSAIRNVKELPIFFSRLAPRSFFEPGKIDLEIPLTAICRTVVLCISGLGFPDAFVEVIKKLDPEYVERVDFSDHHCIEANDMDVIVGIVRDLEGRFKKKPTVVVTEKDYDRDPAVLEKLGDFVKVLVLHSSLQFVPLEGQTEEKFIELITEFLKRLPTR